MGLQSACRADFIVAQGNALGSEVVVDCALNGHFNLLRSNKLRRAFSAQLICSSFSQGIALGYDDSAPLGRIVAIVRVNRQALRAAVGATRGTPSGPRAA